MGISVLLGKSPTHYEPICTAARNEADLRVALFPSCAASAMFDENSQWTRADLALTESELQAVVYSENQQAVRGGKMTVETRCSGFKLAFEIDKPRNS